MAWVEEGKDNQPNGNHAYLRERKGEREGEEPPTPSLQYSGEEKENSIR